MENETDSRDEEREVISNPSPPTSLILPLSINQYPSSLFYNQSIKGITSSKIEDKFSNVLSEPNKQRTRAQK